jgi:ABC-type transport system involved in Fe-S cluster assembly fused permease/ATPase subunit
VALDGHDIRSFQLRSLRRQISLVLQDSLLFRGTIYENIAFGRTGASEAEVRAAAEVAYADEFISKLPEGYQTLVTAGQITSALTADQAIACIRTAVSAQAGMVKEVEAEDEGGQRLCEVKIVDDTGKRYELHVDVTTNQVVKAR